VHIPGVTDEKSNEQNNMKNTGETEDTPQNGWRSTEYDTTQEYGDKENAIADNEISIDKKRWMNHT